MRQGRLYSHTAYAWPPGRVAGGGKCAFAGWRPRTRHGPYGAVPYGPWVVHAVVGAAGPGPGSRQAAEGSRGAAGTVSGSLAPKKTRSRAQAPGPVKKSSRNAQQNIADASPPFCIGHSAVPW